MNTQYLIGQRVLLNRKEIGTVVPPEDGKEPRFGIWVYSPSKGYASDYALHNVQPLPNEQL